MRRRLLNLLTALSLLLFAATVVLQARSHWASDLVIGHAVWDEPDGTRHLGIWNIALDADGVGLVRCRFTYDGADPARPRQLTAGTEWRWTRSGWRSSLDGRSDFWDRRGFGFQHAGERGQFPGVTRVHFPPLASGVRRRRPARRPPRPPAHKPPPRPRRALPRLRLRPPRHAGPLP